MRTILFSKFLSNLAMIRQQCVTPVLVFAVLINCSAEVVAAPSYFTNEAAFNAAVAQLTTQLEAVESFEDDSVWGEVRSTISGGLAAAPSVISQGVQWRANNSTSEVTTGPGPARTGSWGFFSIPHGSYTNPEANTNCDFPGDCGDGFIVVAESGALFAVGGWIDTNTPVAKVGVFPNGYSYFGAQCDIEGIDCNAVAVSTTPQFIGVVDPTGFVSLEYRELEGKTEGAFEGDLKYIFADDFTIAMSLPEPPVVEQVPVALALLIGFATFLVSSALLTISGSA